jgi:hypothetical protein
MNCYEWPKTDENDSYIEGSDWTCCSCGYGQQIGPTEDNDPVSCNRCGGPTCVDCRTDIDYCAKCERETRDEA